MESNMYLQGVLTKYSPRSLDGHILSIAVLKTGLKKWAGDCYLGILDSGSRAKGTAISIASDVDYLISLESTCNTNSGGLKGIYDSLHAHLLRDYSTVRKQNVSFRIAVSGLEIDITPARKQTGNTSDHWLHLSKLNSWKQTNIQRHITDVSTSGRINEIKILKIWRELNGIELPSIYLEYLIIDILAGKSRHETSLADNVWHVFLELKKDEGNPMFTRIVDPANSTNILSDLLTTSEKNNIKSKAKIATQATGWDQIVW